MVVLGLVHQVQDLGLDAGDQRLEVEREDLVQGIEVARVDALTQALKLDNQVVGRIRVNIVAAKKFVDQASGAQARANVGGVEVVVNNANGQPSLADQ